MTCGDYRINLRKRPNFTWDRTLIAPGVAKARQSIGYILGLMSALGFRTQEEAELAAITDTIDNSGKIEGENLGTDAIRSSVARRLGVDIGALMPQDRHVDGVVEMMLDATKNCAVPLTEERLFGWQAALFPTGRSGIGKIRTDTWKDNDSGIDPILKSALAHLWFVTIHPFDDGNGRLARAIAYMALVRADGSPMRFYSVTAGILKERARYYEKLEETHKGGLDVTKWVECRAINGRPQVTWIYSSGKPIIRCPLVQVQNIAAYSSPLTPSCRSSIVR